MKTRWLVFLSFLIMFLVSFRAFLLVDGSFGHNWDWSFPNPKVLYGNLKLLSFFTWKDFNLGWVNDLTISHFAQNGIFSVIGSIVGAKWLIFLLFFFVFMSSFYGFKKLLNFLVTDSSLNYIPAFLYTFSPFLFNDIIGGSWVMWLSYALAPWYFMFLVCYFQESQIKDLIFSVLISTSIMISLQNFVLINVLVYLYLCYEILQDRRRLANYLKKTVYLVVLLLFVNFYWILPFSGTFLNFSRTIIFVNHGIGDFGPIQNSQQSVWNIFSLVGYLDRNMYLHSVPLFLQSLLLVSTVLVWSIILIYFVSENNKNKIKRSLFWLFSLMLLIVIVKGGNYPFNRFTMWLYEIIPFLKIFRSPQHLMLIPAFILPVLLAFSLNYFNKSYKYRKIIIGLVSIFVFVWISGWWYNGDLGHITLTKQNRDHIDFYQLPPELVHYYEQSFADDINYRSFFLPPTFSPSYLETKYQDNAQGVQPEYMYLDKPTFTSDAIPFANRVEASFCAGDNLNYLNFLSLFAVRDIVLRTDIYPKFTAGRFCWDSQKVKRELDANRSLSKFLEGEYLSAYHVGDKFFLPLIYTPGTIIYADMPQKTVSDIVSASGYEIRSAIYSNEYKPKDISANVNIISEYRKINPIKYRVRIYNAKGIFPLILSQNFNNGWKVYIENNQLSGYPASLKSFSGTIQNDALPDGKFYETWFMKPFEENNHLMVNGYANSWIIDAEKLCMDKINCNLEIVIEFQSQKLFYIGLMISGVVFVGLLIYLLIKMIKR